MKLSRFLRLEDAIDFAQRSFGLPRVGGSQRHEKGIARLEGLALACIIGEGDRAFEKMHQLMARKVDELAVIACGFPDAHSELARCILKKFMGMLTQKLRERVQVLERLVTDEDRNLAGEINRLKSEPRV